MVVGLGAEAVIETSITLHRTYGVPCIPGSALKGLTASAANRALEHPDWRRLGADGTPGPSHRLAFGDNDSAGYVTFHDALWWPEGDLPLNLDVMTVHHPDYYLTGDSPPADWDNPIPVPFVSARGTYLLAVTGPEAWADAALDILTTALALDGIGAKTAAGYGRMKVTPLHRPAAKGQIHQKPSAPGQKAAWETWVRSINLGNAEHEVPRVLGFLAGDDRHAAARRMIENLKRKALLDPKRKDKEWVKALLAAAEG